MIEAYWDSSALVLLCVEQKGTPQAEEWSERFGFTVWWATRVEMSGAVARLYRSGDLSLAAKVSATDHVQLISETWHEITPSASVRDIAITVLDRYPLRAADSLQLAAALIWCRNLPAGRTFICADDRLSDAAALAGFTVLRP